MKYRLISWNVNGIRAVEKRGFLNWIESCGADIVMLQETKAHPDQVSAFLREPKGYVSEWCWAEKKGYSGVATFSRQPAPVTRGLGDPRFDCEGRVLISHFPQFTLFNIYYPSASGREERLPYKLDFYKRFLEVVSQHIARGERVIVAGDVNTAYAEIDLARPRENSKVSGFLPEERAALGEFFAAGLVDSFRHHRPTEQKYSWWSVRSGARARNIGWRIDYIFVSENLRDAIVDADTHPEIEGSDHCPVSLTLELPD
jgi:exodeoxyribonuclease III